MKTEPEPKVWPEVFTDAEQKALYDNQHDAWALKGWAKIGRICRDAVRKGALYPDKWCPDPPPPKPD
ncbi:MAG: hypothetical protein ABJP02_04820 [Parasphingorhabdus sp.]|uniref:hypothetical protein n=1 Tax=Parasphingorhabdus sp. TaxID=2709688 RepID=UPI0032986CFB